MDKPDGGLDIVSTEINQKKNDFTIKILFKDNKNNLWVLPTWFTYGHLTPFSYELWEQEVHSILEKRKFKLTLDTEQLKLCYAMQPIPKIAVEEIITINTKVYY